MRKRILPLAAALLLLTALAGWWFAHRGAAPFSPKARAFATALFDLHRSWTTNGNASVLWSTRPPSFKSLNVSGMLVNNVWAYAYERDYIGGFWWSTGYEIRRANTNQEVWTLSRARSFGCPLFRGPRFLSVVGVVTNST
jgi:hypothetical protein